MSDAFGSPSAGFPAPPPNSPTPPPPPNMAPPPGYVPYGGANQGAFSQFQSIRGVARWLGILLIVLIPVLVLSVAKSFGDRNSAEDYLAGAVSEDEFKDTVGATALLGFLSGALVLAIAVLTIIWMFRMAKNLSLISRIGTWKPGWAIGGWFVPPFVLYVIPFLMLRDLWKGSDPDTIGDWRRNRVAPIVTIWWILYGLAPILFLSVTFSNFSITNDTEDAAEQLVDRFDFSVASSVVQILAAIAFAMLVRQLSARHQRVTNDLPGAA